MYSGNVITVTDPAGKWKKYTSDTFGNLTQVEEPNLAGGSWFSNYTCNALNKLTQVRMTRGSTRQTRTFGYCGNFLLSKTEQETGTTQYGYTGNGSLAWKLDAKNQRGEYSDDTLGRLTSAATTSPEWGNGFVYEWGWLVGSPARGTAQEGRNVGKPTAMIDLRYYAVLTAGGPVKSEVLRHRRRA